MRVPKLYIKYAYPLDNDRRKLYGLKGLGEYPSQDEVIEKTKHLQKLWKKLNSKNQVMKMLTDLTGVSLKRDLEMYIFGAGLNAMSNPLMVPIKGRNQRDFSDDEFSETMIHEIVHRFVGDKDNNPGIEKYWEEIRKEYKNESISTQNHIIVYALLKPILTGLFGKKRIKDFMQPLNPGYQNAVCIVNEKGSSKLIKQFRIYVK